MCIHSRLAGMYAVNHGSAELAERLDSGVRQAVTGILGGLSPTPLYHLGGLFPTPLYHLHPCRRASMQACP